MKLKEAFGLNIENVNSAEEISFDGVKFCSRLGILANVAWKVPIYTVDRQTMDMIYPPRKRLLLNEERLSEILRDRDIDINEEFLREVDVERVAVAVGVYVSDDTGIKSINVLKDIETPAIFICPERCISWAEKLNIEPDFIFQKVLYHELAHAYLDTGNINYYDHWWGKVIEESLANVITITRFKDYGSLAKVKRIISSQPIEYRGALVLTDKSVHSLSLTDRLVHFIIRRYGYIDFLKDLSRGYHYYKYTDLIHSWREVKRVRPDDQDFERSFEYIANEIIKHLI